MYLVIGNKLTDAEIHPFPEVVTFDHISSAWTYMAEQITEEKQKALQCNTNATVTQKSMQACVSYKNNDHMITHTWTIISPHVYAKTHDQGKGDSA